MIKRRSPPVWWAPRPAWLDLEYSDTGVVTEASDVFSLGVVLLELLTGKPAYLIGMTPSVTLCRYFKNGTPEVRRQSAAGKANMGAWQRNGASAFAGLATRYTSETADQRPTAAALVAALQNIQLLETGAHRSTGVGALTDALQLMQLGNVATEAHAGVSAYDDDVARQKCVVCLV